MTTFKNSEKVAMYNCVVAGSDSVCSKASAESGPCFRRRRGARMDRVERLLEKMNLEGRSLQRGTPEKLSYIQSEREGGGIVLNASEQGLAFHAASAVTAAGHTRLRLP